MPAPSSPPSLRPPLKWAGGKRWQVPHLRPLWLPHAKLRLVEPFAGGLAVTLGLLPERALLNDANPHLINFYRWLQKGLKTDLEDGEQRTAVLPPAHPLQRAGCQRPGGDRGRRGVVLLPESHRLQRAVPLQQQG